MSDAKQIWSSKKAYGKPAYTRKSVVEVAALLREDVTRPRVIGKPGQSKALVQGPILLVQGYQGSVGLVRQSLGSVGLRLQPNSFDFGDRSVEIGFSARQDASSERSSLLLLDFRPPTRRNRKLLERIGSDPKLQRVPVAVLVDSIRQFETWTQRDPVECWQLHDSLNAADLARALQSFLDLWRLSDELVLSEDAGR